MLLDVNKFRFTPKPISLALWSFLMPSVFLVLSWSWKGICSCNRDCVWWGHSDLWFCSLQARGAKCEYNSFMLQVQLLHEFPMWYANLTRIIAKYQYCCVSVYDNIFSHWITYDGWKHEIVKLLVYSKDTVNYQIVSYQHKMILKKISERCKSCV